MSNNSLKSLSRFKCSSITSRSDRDSWLMLSCVVDNLETVLVSLVDSEARSLINVSRFSDSVRPLVAIVSVSIGEFQIVNEAIPEVGLPLHSPLVVILGVL